MVRLSGSTALSCTAIDRDELWLYVSNFSKATFMTESSASVVFRPEWHANKFLKVPLRPGDTLAVPNCPSCGQTLTPVIRMQAAGKDVLVRGACSPCEILTFSRLPTQRWFEEFYLSNWDQKRSPESIEQKIEAPYDRLFELLIPQIPAKNAAVLEIGSGYGGALSQLRRLGYDRLYGIEASTRRQQVCRKLGLNVALTTAENLANDPLIASGAPYDVVFSWHVIEHVFDLAAAFHAIRQLMKPDGRIIIGVPHFSHEHVVYLGHFLPHVHSFTPQGLARFLTRHGFSISALDDSIRIAARLTPGAVLDPSPGALDRLLAERFNADLGLDRLAPFGNSRPVLFEISQRMFRPAETRIRIPSRTERLMKLACFGPGHNLRPIRTPHLQLNNLLDARNVAHWLGARLLRCTPIESAGRLVWDSSGRRPLLDIVYDGDHGYGWIK